MRTMAIVASGLAALYAAAGIIGSIVQASFGVPGVAGIVMVVFGPFIVVFSLNLFSRFGGTLTMCLIYSLIVIPFHVLGAPGFFPKIGIALAGGLVAELLFLLPFRKSALWNAVVGGAYEIVVGYLIVGLGLWFRLPEIEKVAAISLKWWAIVPSFLVSAFCGYLGYRMYQRIKDRPVIKLAKDRMEGS